jgi:hypothetical protein
VGNGQSEYREERDEGNLETQSAAPSRHCNGQKLGGGALETFSLKTPCIMWTVSELNQELKYWEYIYNCIRPHQALGYLTPHYCNFSKTMALFVPITPLIFLICTEPVQPFDLRRCL